MSRLTTALTIPREKLEKFQTAAHIGGVVAAVLIAVVIGAASPAMPRSRPES